MATVPPATLSASDIPALPKVLRPDEYLNLRKCERVIECGLVTFMEVGSALAMIRDERLYRAEFETFESYCLARWDIRASRARQLCAAVDTVRNLGLGSVTTVTLALPASERQVRPLVGLPPEEQRAAWAEAVATAPNGRVTAAHVQDIVRKRQGLPTEPTPTPTVTQPKTVTVVTPTTGKSSKEERLLQAADRAIAEVRELLALCGTPDSEAAADVVVALETLQEFKDHQAKLGRLHSARAK